MHCIHDQIVVNQRHSIYQDNLNRDTSRGNIKQENVLVDLELAGGVAKPAALSSNAKYISALSSKIYVLINSRGKNYTHINYIL